jgi:hypothetical protein
MAILDKLFGKKKSEPRHEEDVLVHLDGVNLPDEVYASYDLSTLEDQLIEVINQNRAGEFDGNGIGDKKTTLYAYGPNADKLFEVMKPVLRAYPLCKSGRVVIRHGSPGSPQTEVKL